MSHSHGFISFSPLTLNQMIEQVFTKYEVSVYVVVSVSRIECDENKQSTVIISKDSSIAACPKSAHN